MRLRFIAFIVIVVNPVQFLKAQQPIVSTNFGIVTDVKAALSEKAYDAISVTSLPLMVSGIEISVPEPV